MRIGVDLGGTKIEAIALAGRDGIVARRRIATPQEYRGTIDAIAQLVSDIERDVGERCSVGVGFPGAINRAGVVKNANSVWLTNHPLEKDLEARLVRPVRVSNDANCFAMSEAADGAAQGHGVVFGVILGTGVGGGIVIDGHVHEGPNRVAGEWGHNPLPWMTADEYPGPLCYCGKSGCIETFLSGPGFERDFAERTGRNIASTHIVEAAQSGDADATAALLRYHDRLARALALVINILDPDIVVLGGGMSNITGLADATSPLLAKYVFSDSVSTPVVRNMHGDSSGVRGAAWLWPTED